MARSVSYPATAVHRIYMDISWMRQHEDEDGKPYQDDDLTRMNWDDSIETLRAALSKRYKSVDEGDVWIGREDRAISENNHAYFGVSEYNDILCVWVVPKMWEGYGKPHDAFSVRWVASIGKSFEQVVVTAFGRTSILKKLATFSNGESVYRRAT